MDAMVGLRNQKGIHKPETTGVGQDHFQIWKSLRHLAVGQRVGGEIRE
ncbi:MAG TPA: hypothetical protein VKX49_00410 [Bryobacteraceae bacterium]|nr:hypothetical protein [Bryobacteraceae bacterium]